MSESSENSSQSVFHGVEKLVSQPLRRVYGKVLSMISTDTPPENASNEAHLLWEKRPPEVIQAIDIAWDGMNHQVPPKGFLFEGSSDYSFGIPSAGVNVKAILNSRIIESLPGQPIHLLDVGTANGQLLIEIEKAGAEVHGITAHDYRTAVRPLDGIDYRLANAESLLDIYPPNSMDIIVSHVTMRHLVDPLGAIAQMYEVLKPNGVLVLDNFKMLGVEPSFPAVVDYLNQSGYAIVADYCYKLQGNQMIPTECSVLVVRKTHPHLNLPITYNGVNEEGFAIYTLERKLAQKALPLPDDLHVAIKTVAQLTSKIPYIKDFFEQTVFKFFAERGEGETALAEWKRYNEALKQQGMDTEALLLLEEIGKHLFRGIPRWQEMYRNTNQFRNSIQGRLKIIS